ncbi:hypothetical protein JCM33374_g5328 [Metschnikowia sp. JCM 33374]|nr:hypothetical protein JCM33374_g5328 [Metschnikowia sp. JCM 33374]
MSDGDFNNEITKMDISRNINHGDFLRTWFVGLPLEIIDNVCQYLSPETIRCTLLQVPKLRNSIIQLYYTKELRLVLYPTEEPDFYSQNARQNALLDIVSYAEIEAFLVANPDINPQLIKVITSGDFTGMKSLLGAFYSRLVKAPRLEMFVEKYPLGPEDVREMFSFPNLSKFHTSGVTLDTCVDALSSLLGKVQNLKELTLLEHEIYDWTPVELPDGLTHLELSWPWSFTDPTARRVDDESDLGEDTDGSGSDGSEGVERSERSEGVDNLDPIPPFEEHVPIKIQGVLEMLTPSRVKTLRITKTNLHTLNVSQLPPTLETIDLSCNYFRNFESEGNSPCWPHLAKTILLGYNKNFDDSSLKQLSAIAWPAGLETLALNNNHFTSLEHLSHLPPSLKHLDLSRSHIQSFKVEHTHGHSSFFKFPVGLETLDLEVWPDFAEHPATYDVVPLERRMSFPPNLKHLILTSHSATRLAYFVFPPSLETLSLASTEIHDLTTYELALGSDKIVSWTQLCNLRVLDLSHNQIKSLENWCPPKSLRQLDLRGNRIKCLTASNTPLFSELFLDCTNDIETLDFGINDISSIDDNLVLPRNLVTLGLGSTKLKDFVFTDAFAGHNTLSTLDLTYTSLETISVASVGKMHASHLKVFDLSSYDYDRFQMTKQEFYGVFEAMGLVVVDKEQDFHSKHVFR